MPTPPSGPSPNGSPHLADIQRRLQDFIAGPVLGAEPAAAAQAEGAAPGFEPPVLADLKQQARDLGLWNTLVDPALGLSWRDQASLAELTGWSLDLAPHAINGSAPDSVNMVMLAAVADDWQRSEILQPLLDDATRSAFAMTEPAVASSDANNIATRIDFDGDDVVITGRKWYISGLTNPRCGWIFVMGVSDPEAARHGRHSVVAVPADAPGVRVLRSLPVYGYDGDQAELELDQVRVPARHVLGGRGRGFQVAQTRLAAARLHHSCRMVGLAERALSLTVTRAAVREVGGQPLSANQLFTAQLAECRLQVTQARLLNLEAARVCDEAGPRAAQSHISAAKVVATRMAVDVLDRCVATHGAAGLSDDNPLAKWWAGARGLHIADGPEEAHLAVIGRNEQRSGDMHPAYRAAFAGIPTPS